MEQQSHAYSVRATMPISCVTSCEFPRFSSYKMSITLLLFLVCLWKGLPQSEYKSTKIRDMASTITDFILIYKLIQRFCLLACGINFSINSSFFRLNQLTCETPSMWRLYFPSLSSLSEHIVLSALKCWLNSQE